MEQEKKNSTRKKFLLWGAAALTSITAFRFFAGSKKTTANQSNTDVQRMKMLTQDGQLVEVDIDKFFCGKRKKISDEQLKTWVNKK